jgi:hypothetical protein
LQERSSSVEALRGCIAKLREALELRKENHIGADTTLPDASHAILQGRSDLHRLTCELMQMDMRCSELRSVCVAEREVQCMEEERWQEERRHLEMNEAAEQKVVQAEHAELEAMHEAIRCEASQASALRWSESEHAARLDALRAQKRRNLISDKAQLDAWRHEIYAHQLEAQKMNATIHASCRQAEAAAGEAAEMQCRADCLKQEVREIRTEVQTRRIAFAEEEEVCARLSSRLQAREQMITDLKQVQGRWQAQSRALGELEKHLQLLTSRVSHTVPACNIDSAPGLCVGGEDAGVAEKSANAYREEASRILEVATARLGTMHMKAGTHGSKCRNRSSLAQMAVSSHATVRAMRHEAAALLPVVHQLFQQRGDSSASLSTNSSSLRGLLRALLDASAAPLHTPVPTRSCADLSQEFATSLNISDSSSTPVEERNVQSPAVSAAISSSDSLHDELSITHGDDIRRENMLTDALIFGSSSSPGARVTADNVPATTLAHTALETSQGMTWIPAEERVPSQMPALHSMSASSGMHSLRQVLFEQIPELGVPPDNLVPAPCFSDSEHRACFPQSGLRRYHTHIPLQGVIDTPCRASSSSGRRFAAEGGDALTATYPESLAGSPGCCEGFSFLASPSSRTREDACAGAGAQCWPSSPSLPQVDSLQTMQSSPVKRLEIPVANSPPHGIGIRPHSNTGSPGEHVRRARNRLRDLRQGLQRVASAPSFAPSLGLVSCMAG